MINQIQIGVVLWTIKEVKDLMKTEYICGDCNSNNLTIRIDADLNEDHKEHTLMHELLHAKLYTMYESELNDNEKFVNMLSMLDTQVQKQLYKNQNDYR
jgi:Zn-dependent peptidase ImmA (M78 family)